MTQNKLGMHFNSKTLLAKALLVIRMEVESSLAFEKFTAKDDFKTL